ncbi:MAG TPA: universal stress protein [Solirubrobacteraceae bacterium]
MTAHLAMEGPVLLCYDGSDHAARAIRSAATLLRARPAVVVHVLQRPPKEGLAESGRRLAIDAGFGPVRAVEAGFGDVATVILREARDQGAAVIVAGPHRRSPAPPAPLGSVSSALVARSGVPVLVARPGPSPTAAAGPVFACYDGSPIAREAIVTAAGLLAGPAAIVATFMPAVDDGAVLRSTLPWPVAAEVQDRLAQLDREEAEAPFERAAEGARAAADAGFVSRPVGIRGANASSEEEDPWMRLLRVAASEEAACIVVGHRPSVKALGSTAHGLVDHADRSVLVAPGR